MCRAVALLAVCGLSLHLEPLPEQRFAPYVVSFMQHFSSFVWAGVRQRRVGTGVTILSCSVALLMLRDAETASLRGGKAPHLSGSQSGQDPSRQASFTLFGFCPMRTSIPWSEANDRLEAALSEPAPLCALFPNLLCPLLHTGSVIPVSISRSSLFWWPCRNFACRTAIASPSSICSRSVV